MRYTYICSDPDCAKKSGTYTTSIPPSTFPSCKWCGKMLMLVDQRKTQMFRHLMNCLAAVLICSACGSHSPTAPSQPTLPPAPITVTLTGHVTATLSGQPLVGLQAALGTTTTQTDGQGSFSASLLPTAALTLTLTGNAIVPRTLRVAAMNSRDVQADAIAQDGRFDLNFYRQFIRDANESSALQPLRRWTENPSVYLQTSSLVDGRTLDMIEAVTRTAVRDWTTGRFSVAGVERGTSTRVGQPGWLTVVFIADPAHCGTADVGRSGGTITFFMGNTNCGCNGYQMRPTVVRHEVGHAMGFYHTDSVADVMNPVANQCDTPLSARERYHAAIAYTRPVANRDPDDDSAGPVTLAPMRVIQ